MVEFYVFRRQTPVERMLGGGINRVNERGRWKDDPMVDDWNDEPVAGKQICMCKWKRQGTCQAALGLVDNR